MERKYLAFDIETAKPWPDGEDWRSHRPLGITCAATLEADTPTPRFWHGVTAAGSPAQRMSRHDAAGLVDHLWSRVHQGVTILTFNGLGFDFDVLAEESGMPDRCKSLALAHVDMMFHVFCVQGYPVGLQAAAKAADLPGKSQGVEGVMAPQMWADGKHQEVLDYVAQDARTTLDLAALCQRERRFRWITRRGKISEMPLPDGWLTVNSAARLPQPDTSWMSNPLSRHTFTGWLQT